MKLAYKDYIDILKYYKIDFSRMKRKEVKERAEHLLATKLCRCIKGIRGKSIRGKSIRGKSIRGTSAERASEKKAIAICYNSVIRRKGLKTFKFNCKKGARFLPKKGTRKLTIIKLK